MTRVAEFRTRLAPSPTGSLHLGNARTFLVNWLMARRAHGTVVLRVEDLDRPRVKEGRVAEMLEDLRWLGLDHDDGPYLQSERIEHYVTAFERLRAAGRIYPCVCTRKEIASAASAPHADDEGPRYPGTCRGRFASAAAAEAASGRPPAWRFRVDEGVVAFDDRVRGAVAIDPSRSGGDFVVRSFDGTFAYQLAVVVDDAAMGVTEVVRGDDLIPSTPRQILLFDALGARPPRYTHLPLVVGADGRRLAKRSGGNELATLRRAGTPAGDVLRRLAEWSGIAAPPRIAAAADLIEGFDFARVPREPITSP